MKRTLLWMTALLLGAGQWLAQAAEPIETDYKISAQDIIVIDVLGEKDLTKECRVTATGTINYYLIGTVEVGGKTAEEVKDIITERLDKDFLVNPQVTVELKHYRVREVFVNGAVYRPGAIALTGEQDLTILGAIFRAGGMTPRANQDKIKFTRPGKFERAYTLDMLKKLGDADALKIAPGDIIEVGDKVF